MAEHTLAFDAFAPKAIGRFSSARAATAAAVWITKLFGVIFAFWAKFRGYFWISHMTYLLKYSVG
jgi:hypothetical protein